MFSDDLATLITFNPWTVLNDATLDELVRMLQEMGFHHWPVVDSQGRLLGIVSEVDIVRAVIEQQPALLVVPAGVGPVVHWEICGVEELMSRCVITVERRETPRAALGRMLLHRIHSLPVVDEQRLIGMVTTSDFLRELSYGNAPLCREPVRDHLVPCPEPIDVSATLEEASATFVLAGADYLPVVQEDFPLGVVSQREVRKARCRKTARELLGAEAAGGPVTLAQLVSNAPSLLPGQRLAEAAALLDERALQAIVVVNHANRLVGILSEDDLLRKALACP